MPAMLPSKQLTSRIDGSSQTPFSPVSSKDLDDVYSPPLGNREIRLLEIQTAESPHQLKREITYQLKRVSLDANPLPSYTAVSYRWSNRSGTRLIQLASGGSLQISQTLFDLFNSLVTEKEGCLTLWVDAICMRQDDVEEKAAQVLQMGSVYSRATRVLVWLGNSTQTSQKAFRYMQSKSKLADEEHMQKEDLTCLENVFKLLSRPWFRRVWVIQEATVNNNVSVRCGGDEVTFDIFQQCVDRIWTSLDFSDGHRASGGFWCVTRLFDIRDKYQKDNKLSYESLLEAAFHYNASDPRDRVYAFRGIADNSRPVPAPDYAKSAETLFVETAQALLCHGRCLDLLVLCGFKYMEDRSSEVPTWAPNFYNHSWDEPLVVANKAGWNAGGPFVVSPRVDDRQPGLLHIRARLITKIKQVLPALDCETVTGQQAAMDAILGLRPIHVPSHDWLDTVFNTLIFGLNIDDERDLAGYRESFHEWLTWLQSESRQPDPRLIAQNKYHLTMKNRVNGWKVLMTGNDMFGVSSPSVAEDDCVFVIPGCRLPLILRADQSLVDSTDDDLISQRTWELVSWSFIDGLMFDKGYEMRAGLIDVTLR